MVVCLIFWRVAMSSEKKILRLNILLCGMILFIAGCQTQTKENRLAETSTASSQTINYVEAAKINTQLAAFYIQQGNYDLAKQKLLIALKQNNHYPYTYSVLAYYNEKTGDNESAEKNYRQAIKLAPNDGTFHNNYGRFLCLNKKYTGSLVEFNLAVSDKNYIDTSGAYENAGLCALKIPNDALAEQYFSQAINQNPNLSVSLYELSIIEYQFKKYQLAKMHLWQYSQLVPVDRDAALLGIKIAKKTKDGQSQKYYEEKLSEKQ